MLIALRRQSDNDYQNSILTVLVKSFPFEIYLLPGTHSIPADSNGNPIGGLVFGNTFGPNLQYHEWTSFISDSEFCMRACTGPNARENCQHTYDGARFLLLT